MVKLIEEFKGDMSEKEVPATAYSYWNLFFYSSLLKA